ncbi:MAG: succinylglutamate desuccinylase/aspartoacylase family protein [Rhodobiaceae bacterium]|nr:succinylglutamate desuccinylase/aspartoacylase family protein [Rhodobiaceae bacterium]
MRAPDFSATRLSTALDFVSPGKRTGTFRLAWSSNENPLGHYPVPVMVAVGQSMGPTVLLTAGVHGDEYEGPVALMRLFRDIDPAMLSGRLIVLPALNAPAVRAATRVSPLDGGNLNRAFPGDRNGGPTAMIAHMVETCLMPVADAVIDLHSGGKASWFVPCALAARAPDGRLDAANMALARAFGTPLIWVLGRYNDDRSVNGAATRSGVPAIAAELGGGGTLTPAVLEITEAGLRGCLSHLGALPGRSSLAAPTPRAVEIATAAQSVAASSHGLYQPLVKAGGDVVAGTLLGLVHDLDRPDAEPAEIRAPCDGMILAETRRGLVAPGDFLAIVASDVAL